MASLSMSKKNANQNIQVFVRLRPMNSRERELKCNVAVEVGNGREVTVRQPQLESRLAKKFTFDRAFGPSSHQADVYKEVVSPLIGEVLAGYNCTVFAYGQTGTGKTHTMVGESTDLPWQDDPMAGIIPRSLAELFSELRLTNSEYTVRVSYLELYNEELFDLLSTTDDNSKLRIYEDVTRKGSNIVNGLEEMTVYGKNEVYKIMARGQERRRTASTLMNAQSSRSHTVFTIVVHMKENSPDGEELMKIGKLNLVDLAGSENISKAGTDNPSRKERARECVNINQSLLTLGRVITALVERHPHIPYRESKLTRLLQESLGGRTKTSIIATISPGSRDVEETLSTLEYAHRARNIQNKPEINQKMTKKAVLKEYSEEIDRLKRDLQASRDRNGVYLATETYSEMTLKMEEQEKEIQEQILFIKAMKEERARIENLFKELSTNLKETENKLDVTVKNLDHTKSCLNETTKELATTRCEVDEQKHLVSAHVDTENKLGQQAKELLTVADTTTSEINLLHNTLDKKRILENSNLNATKTYKNKSEYQREKIKDALNNFTSVSIETFNSLCSRIDGCFENFMREQNNTKSVICNMFGKIKNTMETLDESKKSNTDNDMQFIQDEFKKMNANNEICLSNVSDSLKDVLKSVLKLDEARHREQTEMEEMKKFVEQWKCTSKTKLLLLQNGQNKLWDDINKHFIDLQEQHDNSSQRNIQEAQKAVELHKRHNNEWQTELTSLKSIILSLEEKHVKHKAESEAINEANEILLKNNSVSFKDSLTNSHRVLTDNKTGMDNTMSIFNEAAKSFETGIKNKLEMYGERVNEGCSIDKEIRETLLQSENALSNSRNNIAENGNTAMKEIISTHSETISKLHESQQVFLQDCHSQSNLILQPIDETINGINHHKPQQQEISSKFNVTMTDFVKDMNETMVVYNDMEYQFINEEYRLYSPTGKTPIRRGYAYPIQLVSTSPHDRILMRYRNIRQKNLKNENLSFSPDPTETGEIINLDQTEDLTPLKCSKASSRSEGELNANSTPIQLDDSSVTFVDPKSIDASFQNNIYMKSPSESNLLILNNKQSKENLNFSNSSDKAKDAASRLKQPTSFKKVLGSKNS